MRPPHQEPEEAKFAMAPMIDMVFLLLVFFMCASHLSQSERLTLEIPTASKGVIPKERPDRWVVNIDTNGTVYSGPKAVSIDELRSQLAARVKENPNTKVYIRADGEARHREVKKVMAAMAEAGIDDLIFGVYTPTIDRPEGAAP